MSGIRCPHCGGIVDHPRRGMPAVAALDVHDASCPGILRVRKDRT